MLPNLPALDLDAIPAKESVTVDDHPQTNHRPESAAKAPRKRNISFWAVLALACLLAATGGVSLALVNSNPNLSSVKPVSIVPVVRAKEEPLSEDVTFSAEFLPYQEVDVHAKVAGYVKQINVDIGDHVKAGQVLAVLEVPELQDDLKKANAAVEAAQQDVLEAQANYTDAHLDYNRLLQVSQQHANLIAEQDLEDAKTKDQAEEAGLAAAQREVEEAEDTQSKMLAMVAYSQITAPFDGIVTKRFADTGALVQAGTTSNSQAMPVVTLAQDNLLRLQFPVQESDVPRVQIGEPVDITVDSLGETFRGKVTRFTGKIDTSTRTMITEVDVPNDQYRYRPGMYATARLVLDQDDKALCIPIQALSGPSGRTVMVLNDQNVLEQHTVETGLQTASMVQILSGLAPNSLVLMAKDNQFKTGEHVEGQIVQE